MKKLITLICAVFLFSTCFILTPVSADEIHNLFEQAKKAYDAKKYKEALEHLQNVIQKIEVKRSSDLTSFFPPAPEGMTVQKMKDTPVPPPFMSGLGTTVDRRYISKDKSKEIMVTFILDSPLIAQVSMLFTNPMMMSASQGLSKVQIKDHDSTKKVEGNRVEFNILVANNIMAQVRATGLGEKEATKFAESIDFKGLKENFGK